MDWISSSSSLCWAWAKAISLPVFPQHSAGTVQGGEPNADLQALLFLVKGDELLGLFRLDPQGFHPVFQLGEDVPQPHQVVLGLGEPPLRLLFAVTVAGDACGLLKDLPAVLGTGGHNAVDLALTDDGIAVSSQARVHKQLVDILQAHGGFVDEVLALPGTVIPPGDRHGVVVKGQTPVSVVNGQGDLGVTQGFPLGRAVKDHVLHLRAAQGAHRLLPQHPAHGVADVAFPAAVGPTTEVIPRWKSRVVLSGKVLNPCNSKDFKIMAFPLSLDFRLFHQKTPPAGRFPLGPCAR